MKPAVEERTITNPHNGTTDRYNTTLSASRATVRAVQRVAQEQPEKANLLGRLFDAEGRRHHSVQNVIDHVTKEGLLANRCFGVLADEVVIVGLETEHRFEQTIAEYDDSELALGMAPTYIEMARSYFVTGASSVMESAIHHITTKVSGR